MFEKEAEEYADKNATRGGGSSFGDETNYHDLRQAFKDGAEFGYNKAKEELAKGNKKLKWTDLKVGDVIRHKESDNEYLVVAIDNNPTIRHICTINGWMDNEELSENFIKE